MSRRSRPRPGRRFVISLTSAAIAAAFVACGAGGRPASTAAGAETAAGGTLHVVMVEPPYQGFDPQASFTQGQFELLRCCLVRTLMTYRGVAGFAGTHPVPDLAVAPPTVSDDGTTWTFRLRRGIHYAPPLEDVEIRADDLVRALLRSGSSDSGGGPGAQYLSVIEGFDEYAEGKADAIAGVSTPDDHTLIVRATRVDRAVEHIFAMPFTAPIPAARNADEAPFGVATGHPFSSEFQGGPPELEGYGRFLVGSGPYMIEGSERLDPSLPPEQQDPVSGLTPGWWFDDPGSLTLVRNPSWSGATDPNRPAYLDRIEISLAPTLDPYEEIAAGDVDVAMSENPPPEVAERYRTSEALRDRIAVTTGNFTRFLTLNLAQPPFDDVHVRRAVAFALDRATLTEVAGGSTASHIVPDAMIGSLLAAWDPFPSSEERGDLEAARREMNASRYGEGGRCVDPVCRDVLLATPDERFDASIRSSLRAIGIEARPPSTVDCSDPRKHVDACAAGWVSDFPEAGNMLVWFLASDESHNPAMVGATPRQLVSWGYRRHRMPSIDGDHERCSATAGVQAAMCWARLDQLLTERIVAIVPFTSAEVIRVHSADVTAFTLDQAFGEPALDRISVG